MKKLNNIINEKMELLKDAEKIVDEIYEAWENPSCSVYGSSARIWGIIKKWNIDLDNKLIKKENKGYFISLVAMMLSIEKDTVNMCIYSKVSSCRGSKWDTIVGKFLKTSLMD